MASFHFDARLYNELLGIRTRRIAAIKAAQDRGESVEHVVSSREPLHNPNLQTLRVLNDDAGPVAPQNKPQLDV